MGQGTVMLKRARSGDASPREITEAAALDPKFRQQVGVALVFLRAVEASRIAAISTGAQGRCSSMSAWGAWEEVRDCGGLWRHAKLGWILGGLEE
jgi:hypothetical protein